MKNSQELKSALRILAQKLEEEKASYKHLAKLFESFFPTEAYKRLRPDVNEATKGDDSKIVKHFIKQGYKETDVKNIENKKRGFYALSLARKYFRDVSDEAFKESLNQADSEKKRILRLSKTLGDRRSMENNQAHVFAQQRTLLHLKSNTVCTWIPKNACSNLRYSIALANGVISTKYDVAWIHNIHNSLYASNKELLTAKYSFVVLRNPFKRLLSFFLDKICHKNSESENDTSYRDAQHLFNVSGETTFEDIVTSIWSDPELLSLEQHIRPQSDFLIFQKYDSYYQLEKFSDFTEDIAQKINLKIIDVRDFNSIHTSKGLIETDAINSNTSVDEIKKFLTKGEKPMASNMYTDEMIQRVSAIYFNDILIYLKNTKHGLDELEPWINRIVQA